MKKFLLVVAFLVVPLVVNAEDSKWKWTKTDTVFQGVAVATQVADWAQTRYMARNWQRQDVYWKPNNRYDIVRYYEMNPILGDYPSMGKVNTYFVGSILGNALVSAILPNPYRRIWQTVSIVVEVGFAAKNYNLGVKMRF